MTTYIIVVIVLVAIALFAERELYRRSKNEGDEGSTSGAIADRLFNATSQLFGTVRETGEEFVTPQYVKLVPKFRHWVEEDMSGHDHLRRWLTTLPDEGFKALTNQLVMFCNELNIELAWLVDGELDIEPKLKPIVEDIVITYCESCLKAVQIQTELIEFRDYQNMLERLSRRDQREVGQELLAQLREKELVPPASPDMVWASDEVRREYALRSIKDAARQDRETFNRVWKDVVMTTDA